MTQIVKKMIPYWALRIIRRLRSEAQTYYLERTKLRETNLDKFKKGINLIGPIGCNSGLGQSCKLLEQALMASSIEYTVTEWPKKKKGNIKDRLIYGVNIFHINAHEFEPAFFELRKQCWDEHYNIAFWLWELEEFPLHWASYAKFFDEIWTPAEFVSRTIRRKVDIPVKTIPYWITVEIDESFTRESYGLPGDMFLFFMAFDSNSVSERKNPYAVIEAFKMAFNPGKERVGLAIKVNHAQERDLKLLESQLVGYNIYFIKEIMPKKKMNSLIRLVDVYVSLHRAEGFGLVIAESMLLGTPVIATNYSANIEFMNPEVACMVDYEMVTLKTEIWPYEKGSRWAEPDVLMAAEYMRKLFFDTEFYNKKMEFAKRYVKDLLSKENAVRLIMSEYNLIYKELE